MAKKETTSGGILNPYKEGVTYDQFLASIPEGTSVEEAVNSIPELADEPGVSNKHKREWIVSEIESHKSHQANKAANLKRANEEHAALYKENEK